MSPDPPEKSRKRVLTGDDKVIFVTLRGRLATNWRRLLKEEDNGSEAAHLRAALTKYIKRKGYDK